MPNNGGPGLRLKRVQVAELSQAVIQGFRPQYNTSPPRRRKLQYGFGRDNAASIDNSNSYPAIILTSANLTRWKLIVDVTGNLDTIAAPTGPAGAYAPTGLVLSDSVPVYWTVTIQNSGNLVTTSGGVAAGSLQNVKIRDANGRVWILTVATTGNLVTT